ERFEEAAGVWEELLGLKRDYLVAWMLYGRTLLHLGRPAEARQTLEAHALPLAHQQGHAGPIEEIQAILDEIGEAPA
ncbi:MAG: tetratricopeptide repeat protein, partial [Deltaproteobacteria bacterium]|nr:tetratricopeptide repeat protein [Deltaproteobacteria bacterium]